jgi:2-oxoglutarate/2-oxoacid ferredoxin oxidoreductase subunit alpha
MKETILIGGKAGQGINKVSEIITNVLGNYGYHVFNYRDYPSLIRGGHNFNLLTFSDHPVFSNESKVYFIIALDEDTFQIHKSKLNNKKNIILFNEFSKLGRDSNIAQAAAFLRILGINKKDVLSEVGSQFNHPNSLKAAEDGFNSQDVETKLNKLSNKIHNLTGNNGIVRGALKSGLNVYISYPMTPSTGVLHEIGTYPNIRVFQPESEVAGINQAIGSSFTGSLTMIGTSGGGFDLMSEGLSFAGMSEIPITIYLASRPGPSTGIPTYTGQGDLNIAIYSGHGEFPRVVVCPGSPEECEEKTNEAIFLSEKFRVPSIILSDKHLAESGFSAVEKIKFIKIKQNRNVPGKGVVKATSYEHDYLGNTIEDANIARLNAEKRIKKFKNLKNFLRNLTTYKIYGKPKSKKLIISCGSTKGAILDSLAGGNVNFKFLQIIYLHPFSEKIANEIKKYLPSDIIIVENNSTAQLADLIRKETGIEIKKNNRILRYDGRPFLGDELLKELTELIS